MTDSNPSKPLKHYRSSTAEVRPWPALFFEINLEFQDPRSRYRDSCRAYFEAEWIEDEELGWTPDMVQQVALEGLEECEPSPDLDWPLFGDQKIIRYLIHYYRPEIWRNRALGLFSHPGESKPEFLKRCFDLVLEERERELKKSWDVFVHRYLELEQRLMRELEKKEAEREWERRLEQIRSLFYKMRDEMGLRALPDEKTLMGMLDSEWKLEIGEAGRERVAALRRLFGHKFDEICQFYDTLAQQVDRYEVPLTYPQIEIVSRGIVWNRDLPGSNQNRIS